MAITADIHAKRQSLAGCVFRTFDFQNLVLNFYDDKHCECSQYFSLPLPNDSAVRVDTLRYKVSGDKVTLYNPHAVKDTDLVPTPCLDFFAVRFPTSYVIERDGEPLRDYSIVPHSISAMVSPIVRGCWEDWKPDKSGYICMPDMPDIMFYNERTLYLTKGQVPTTNHTKRHTLRREPTLPLSNFWDKYETFGYKWFHRERASSDTDSTRANIIGQKYVCVPDTLMFVDDSICSISNSSQHTHRYRVDGAYVLIYGWDKAMSDKADSLVYQDRVLYHACVTHFSNWSIPITAPAAAGLSSTAFLGYTSTAKMETRAYVREDADVTDEQIGTTFLHVFLPLNFHQDL